MEWRLSPTPRHADAGTSTRNLDPRAASRRPARLLLLEAPESKVRERIAQLARDVGLDVEFIDTIDALPSEAAVVGLGPGVREPLAVARRIRSLGAQTLVVFLAASAAGADALKAELIRNPFAYSRYELIQLDLDPRQLRAHLARLLARVPPQHGHPAGGRRLRRGRNRPGGGAPMPHTDQQLASILAQAKDAIFSTDDHGRLSTWNRSAERMLGYAAEQVVGEPLEVLDVPDVSSRQLSVLAHDVLSSGEPTERDVTLQPAAGDGCVLASASVAPLRDTSGHIVGLSIIARDSSERIRAEEALRDANRQKDEFLAIMSHELRTPLTSILGYTDMLLRGLSGPLAPRTTKYVGNVRAAGDRLLDLVNGLLDYTRLEAGVERLELRPLDLSELVHRIAHPFLVQAEGKGITLAIEEEPVGTIMGDREKVEHVLRSYLGNAVKFTPSGGRVSLHVGPDPEREGWVRVAVADSGIGLRDEQISRVWDRFYQGDASLTRPYGGMGLGLSIARHLVLLHGGTVSAESRGPGHGSTFSFCLPRQPAA